MKVGVLVACPGLGDAGFLRAVGELVEELGLDSLWLADHVVFPREQRSRYPYSPDGQLHTPPYPEPLATLAFLAAVTTRVELGTGVLVLPQRHPVLVAKQAATVHQLSGGRLRLGVGVGWLREELELLGFEFGNRGERTDEAIDVMRVLWREERPRFAGRFTTLDGSLAIEPRPPGLSVPVVVGGHSDQAARRAARRADGFFPMSFDLAELARLYELVHHEARDAGRDPSTIELMAMTPPERRRAEQLADLGAGHLVVPAAVPGADLDALRARLAPAAELRAALTLG